MTSSVSLALLFCLASTLVPAGASRALTTGEVQERVTQRIARAWDVEPAALRIEWSRVSEDPSSDAELLNVLGNGHDGWFAVLLRDRDEGTRACRIRAGVADTVQVAARPLAAGTRIASGDLRTEVRLRWGPRPARPARRPRIGWEVLRPLVDGEPATPPAVVPPVLVRAGNEVELRWQRHRVCVTTRGVALNSAREGENVRVRIAGRTAPMIGRINSDGIADLDEEVDR